MCGKNNSVASEGQLRFTDSPWDTLLYEGFGLKKHLANTVSLQMVSLLIYSPLAQHHNYWGSLMRDLIGPSNSLLLPAIEPLSNSFWQVPELLPDSLEFFLHGSAVYLSKKSFFHAAVHLDLRQNRSNSPPLYGSKSGTCFKLSSPSLTAAEFLWNCLGLSYLAAFLSPWSWAGTNHSDLVNSLCVLSLDHKFSSNHWSQ